MSLGQSTAGPFFLRPARGVFPAELTRSGIGEKLDTHTCDVLVIGGGGAALRAALASREVDPRIRVLVATKGELGRSGVTATACSDRMAFHATLPYTEPGGPENWRHHAEDIYRIGGFVSDWDLAEILARGSGEAFAYLDRLGVPFVKRSNGEAAQFVTDGSQYARACYTGPCTANDIEKALVGRIRQLDLPVVEHCTVADLMVENGQVVGAVGLVRDAWVHFEAKAVVLACGGGGRAFRTSVFPAGATGDGYAMACRAGAELVNMEFIQIGLSSVTTQLALSGSVMRSVPKIVDSDGRELLYDYFPPEMTRAQVHNIVFRKGSSWPVCWEHVSSAVDIAVFKETAKGKPAFLDFGENPEGFDFRILDEEARRRYEREIEVDLGTERRSRSPLGRLQEINPRTVAWLRERGIDLNRGDRIEIAPAVQHFQGGVKIRADAQSSLSGLYAAGECAGAQHGANRPGGNALMDCQVFGKIAGREAAGRATRSPWPQSDHRALARRIVSELAGRLKRGMLATDARRRIQNMLSTYASVVRTEVGLEAGLDRVARLKHEGIRADEQGMAYAVESYNMLFLAEMILGAARLRIESRGPHLFFDHFDDRHPRPGNDEQWRRYIVIHQSPDGMRFDPRVPVGNEARDER